MSYVKELSPRSFRIDRWAKTAALTTVIASICWAPAAVKADSNQMWQGQGINYSILADPSFNYAQIVRGRALGLSYDNIARTIAIADKAGVSESEILDRVSEGWTFPQIADFYGVPVKWHDNAYRLKLRDYLAAYHTTGKFALEEWSHNGDWMNAGGSWSNNTNATGSASTYSTSPGAGAGYSQNPSYMQSDMGNGTPGTTEDESDGSLTESEPNSWYEQGWPSYNQNSAYGSSGIAPNAGYATGGYAGTNPSNNAEVPGTVNSAPGGTVGAYGTNGAANGAFGTTNGTYGTNGAANGAYGTTNGTTTGTTGTNGTTSTPGSTGMSGTNGSTGTSSESVPSQQSLNETSPGQTNGTMGTSNGTMGTTNGTTGMSTGSSNGTSSTGTIGGTGASTGSAGAGAATGGGAAGGAR